MNKKNFEIAIYEMFQMVLIDKELVDKHGIPPRKTSKLTFEEQESINVYKWIAGRIKGSKQADFDSAKNEFNKYAKNMHDEVWLNMYLMCLFMFDHYLADSPKNMQIRVGGKITRLIAYMRDTIIRVEDRNAEIITDSSMAASNIYRGYIGKPELTREVRAARLAKWRNVAKSKKK